MRRFRRVPTVGLVVAAVLFVAGQAVAEGSADLAITRMTGPGHARVGDTIAVTITAVGRTQESDLLLDQIVGITISDNLELGAGAIDCNGALASSDGFNCEPGSLPPYQSFLTVVHLNVLGGGARFGQVSACTSSGNGVVDTQPRNDCRTFKIAIVGKLGQANAEREGDHQRRPSGPNASSLARQ